MIDLTNNNIAIFDGKEYDFRSQFEYLGNDSFHLMVDSCYKYFELKDILINGNKVTNSTEVINFLINGK